MNLTITYRIPPGGLYIYDKLAKEIAGPHATETSFGSIMFTSRIITYEYPTEETLNQAHTRFTQTNIFRTIRGN